MKETHALGPCPTYHLLGNIFRDVLLEVEGEFDGLVFFVLALEFLHVLNAQPQLDGNHLPIVLLGQFHAHTCLFLEEGVVQEVFDGISEGQGRVAELSQGNTSPQDDWKKGKIISLFSPFSN